MNSDSTLYRLPTPARLRWSTQSHPDLLAGMVGSQRSASSRSQSDRDVGPEVADQPVLLGRGDASMSCSR